MLNGFLLVDKIGGEASFKTVMKMRKMFREKSVGFAGTLDPLATGLLILACGEYTKLLTLFEGLSKTYEVRLEFGKTSDTFDVDGEVKKHDLSKFVVPEKEIIENLLSQKFSGEIMQIPPKFSAIQINGQRAYDLARKGLAPEMKARKVCVHDIKVLSFAFPFLDLEIHCSSGTYVRSIVHDLGEELSVGAIVTALRRTAVGDFLVQDAVRLDEESWAAMKFPLLDAKMVLSKLVPCVEMNADEYNKIVHGNFVKQRFDGMKLPIAAFFEGQIFAILEAVKDDSSLLKAQKIIKA